MASASLGDDGSCGCARRRRLYIVLSSSANDTCSAAASPAERLTSLKICRKGASSSSALRFKLALSCRRWLCSNWPLYVLISTQAWCFSCPSLFCPAKSGHASLSVIVLSCKVRPCQFVRHCPVLQCLVLHFQRPLIGLILIRKNLLNCVEVGCKGLVYEGESMSS